MDFIVSVILIVVAFVAGILFGRANPTKTEQIKDWADKAKDEVKKATKG